MMLSQLCERGSSCAKEGHLVRDCRKAQAPKGQCFNCGEGDTILEIARNQSKLSTARWSNKETCSCT